MKEIMVGYHEKSPDAERRSGEERRGGRPATGAKVIQKIRPHGNTPRTTFGGQDSVASGIGMASQGRSMTLCPRVDWKKHEPEIPTGVQVS